MHRSAVIVILFLVVGPLIGLATVAAMVTVVAIANVEAGVEGDVAAIGGVVLLYGVFFAHFFGAIWAGLAGAIVALRASLWGPASIFEGVPIGVLTALASVVFWDAGEMNFEGLERAKVSAMSVWALVHVVPAMACIWITRRWQSAAPGPA